jgi:23S rRNA (guanosine2251-2'-O)-methyltransferase
VANRPRKHARRRADDGRKGSGWLYGRHAVAAALANPARHAVRLVVAAGTPEIPVSGGIEPEIVAREALEALLPPGAVHQGIALQADPLPDLPIEEVCARAGTRDSALVVVLDQVTDPHNIGAVLRSAAVFGALAVVVQDRHAPPQTGVMAKAASGALESVPLVRVTNLARALETLKSAGFWCVGLDAAAPAALDALPPAARRVLVLGAEGPGMRRLTRETCDELARIDGPGPLSSLNVSSAAAVALYALSRGPSRS